MLVSLKNATKMKPKNRYGANFLVNVSCISNAKPNAGKIPAAKAKPPVSQSGINFTRDLNTGAPKSIATKAIKNGKIK